MILVRFVLIHGAGSGGCLLSSGFLLAGPYMYLEFFSEVYLLYSSRWLITLVILVW